MRPIADPVARGQESVWDYPRPAIAQPTRVHIVIEHAGRVIADTHAAVRTIETSHPPSYYIPPSDVVTGVLRKAAGSSYCEWKGEADYWDALVGDLVLPRVGWSYPNPTGNFAMLQNYVAFYARPFDRCMVDGEVVTAQPGNFYGGWISSAVTGPFKGGPGTGGW